MGSLMLGVAQLVRLDGLRSLCCQKLRLSKLYIPKVLPNERGGPCVAWQVVNFHVIEGLTRSLFPAAPLSKICPRRTPVPMQSVRQAT